MTDDTIVGKEFNFLFVESTEKVEGRTRYIARCTFKKDGVNECGKKLSLTKSNIVGDRSYKSCGCYKKSAECKKIVRTRFKNFVSNKQPNYE